MAGCDIFNADTVNTEKAGEELSITEVQNLDKLYVDPGIEEKAVIDKLNNQRDKVNLVLNNDSKVSAEIAWEGANGQFDPEEPGTYEFKGTALYNDLSTDISIQVVVDNRFSLSLEIIGEGEILDKQDNVILSSPDQKKEIRYDPGTTLQFTAVSNRNWGFMGWKGDKNIKQSTVEITMDEHKELQAVFGKILIYDVEKDFSSVLWSVSGKLENLIGNKIEYVEIHVEIYDEKDELITSEYNVKSDIADGEIVDWIVSKFWYFQSESYYKIILRNMQLEE